MINRKQTSQAQLKNNLKPASYVEKVVYFLVCIFSLQIERRQKMALDGKLVLVTGKSNIFRVHKSTQIITQGINVCNVKLYASARFNQATGLVSGFVAEFV